MDGGRGLYILEGAEGEFWRGMNGGMNEWSFRRMNW